MKRFISIFLFFFLSGGLCYGQTLPFRTYSIEQGLSESVVNDLLQDHEGYLWIATGYGLNRFDGIHFKNFYMEDGLLSNKIYALYEDSSHTLWVGTAAGVNIIEQDTIKTLASLKPLKTCVILDIFQDRNGEYWFATDGQGVWHFDNNQSLTQFITVHGLANNHVYEVVENRQGTLWFGTQEGLTRLKNGNFRTFTEEDGLADNRIHDLQLGRNGALWIATRGGLSRFYQGSFTNFTQEDGLISNRIRSISLDKNGDLWLGTEEGASHFVNGTFTNYTVKEGLSNNIIHATLYDRENNIWFGTYGGGVNLYLGDYIKNYTIEDGLPNNVVTDITQNKQGRYWIATYGGGLLYFNGNEVHIYDRNDGLADNKVYTLLIDQQGQLLAGTQRGVNIFKYGTPARAARTLLPNKKIRAIEAGSTPQTYWFGTDGAGAVRFQQGSFTFYTEEDSLANNTVVAIEKGKDGSIWLATYGGVSRYKEGEFTNYTIRDGLPNNGILDIFITSKGTVWVSTFGGIAKFEEDHFIAITPDDGLPAEVCYSIARNKASIFWIGTNEGIIRFDYPAYKSTQKTGTATSPFKLITQKQGLITNEMNTGAVFVDQAENVWFGSVGGLILLDSVAVSGHEAPPSIHIQRVEVAGKVATDQSNLIIENNERDIVIEYVGINFTAPKQMVYYYRLKNSGTGWQQTSQRRIRYSALSSGDYIFQIKAQNSEGVWSTQTAAISFTVLAPFWLRWWFIVLVVLILAGIVLFIYNYYRVRKMVDIERMRVRIASDLHDDVGSSLTEIALQSDFLQTTDASDQLKESVRHIGAQSRKIVSSLDDIVWSIDARNDTLGDLTDRMQDYANHTLPDRRVTYQLKGADMDEKLTVAVKENLYLIFKEAINNIAKHSNATKVEVKLQNDAHSFVLVIHDNGTNNPSARKTGHGLRNMNMRAQRINGSVIFGNESGFTVQVESNES